MAKYKYSLKLAKENSARAVIKDADISTKSAIEICAKLRNKSVVKSKEFLESVMIKKRAVKFTRFVGGAGHKTKMGSGKYPVKSAEAILKTIKSAESNASDKGLDKNLKIAHISAQKASRPWHYGRKRRIKMKRTHLEVIVKEKIEKKVERDPNKTEIINSSKKIVENKTKELSHEKNRKRQISKQRKIKNDRT